MHNIVLFFSIVIFTTSGILYAGDINDLIIQIKNAKTSDKRELINTLKIKLRSANQASRQAAMSALKKSYANRSKPTIQPIVHPSVQTTVITPVKVPSHIDVKHPSAHKSTPRPKLQSPTITKPSRPFMPHKR